jgi:hypothetical protein
VKPFLGNKTCDDLTQLGRNCILPKVFENKSTEQEIDCTWYCLAKCTPEKLLPIFHPPKWIIVERKGEERKIAIDQNLLSIIISNVDTGENLISIYKNRINPLLWDYDVNDSLHIENHGQLNTNQISRLLCRIFRKISYKPTGPIEFQINLFTSTYTYLSSYKIKRFSHPYIRPTKDWETDFDDESIVLIFAIDLPDVT